MTANETADRVDRQGLAGFTLLASLYAAGVATVQLPTVLAVQSADVPPYFPPWIFRYLLALCALLLVLGFAAGALAALALMGKRVRVRPAAAVALTIAVLVVVHGYVLINHDGAVAEGGMIWGLFHVLTLTREVSPAGPTDAGMAGYRIGQVVGLIGLLLWPLSLFALSLPATPEPPDDGQP